MKKSKDNWSDYPEFGEFHWERLEAKPWDWSHNEVGFPPEEKNVSSDISAHLPFLEYVASFCSRVTEFGTRGCFSTSAFIAGCNGEVISYDIHSNSIIMYLQELSRKKKLPCKWTFEQRNILEDFKIKPTDLLFSDALHTYENVKLELSRHASEVRKWLIFHDTSIFSQGLNSVDRPGEKGILPAIEEFMQENPNWKKVYEVQYNHGLLMLERTE